MSRFEEMSAKLASNQQLQPAIQWYQALTTRDQAIVKGLAGFCVAALVFLLVYAPLIKDQGKLQNRLDRAVATYNKIAENAHKFGGAGGSSGAPILSLVTQEARNQAITLSRYEQDGKGLRVWVEKVSFDEGITWLENLNAKHGIRVSQINIDRKDNPGWVDIRATLTP